MLSFGRGAQTGAGRDLDRRARIITRFRLAAASRACYSKGELGASDAIGPSKNAKD
jgi:hypothetical protein